MRICGTYLMAISLVFLFWLDANAATTQYRMIDLGIPTGFAGSSANSVNNRGEIVGSIRLPNGQAHAALWKNGVPTDLGTFGGLRSWASCITDSGIIAGGMGHDGVKSYGYILQNGEITFLTSPDGGECAITAINENGFAVGLSSSVSGSKFTRHATVWENGVPTDLGTLGGTWSEGRDININNEIVDYGHNSEGDLRAALWRDGVLVDIGLNNVYSGATAINDSGQIAGYYGPRPLGFLYSNASITSLTTANDGHTTAWDINNNGQIAGCHMDAAFVQHACVWQNGEVIDLGSLGGTSTAWGISDSGLIVGESYNADGLPHAVLWEPVPEPSCMFVLFGGLGGMFFVIRRKRMHAQ